MSGAVTRAQANLTQSTTALDLPVCIVPGGLDPACQPDTVRASAALIKGVTYNEIADIGHLPSVETPAELGGLISDFIDEVHRDGP